MRKNVKLAGVGGLVAAVVAGIVLDSTTSKDNMAGGPPERVSATVLQPAANRMLREQTAEFTLTVPVGSGEVTAEGEARFVPDDLAMRMTMEFNDRTLKLRVVDDDLFVDPPAGMSPPSMGKPWVKIEPGGALSDSYGSLIDRMRANLGPGKMLQQIMRAGSIMEHERSGLHGQDGHHYSIHLDYGKVPEQYLQRQLSTVPSEYRDGMLSALADTSTRMELWLDADKLPRKITLDMGPLYEAAAEAIGKPSAADELGDGEMEVTYSDWGIPVNISAPASSLIQ